MTQIKEEVDIPSLDDFTESSLLDQIKTKSEEEEENKETEEERETRETKEAEEEEAKLVEEEKTRLAKEQEEEELTEEEKEALKAEEEKKEEDAVSFWDDVEAITGNKYEVDFGEVAPDSPEGAAIREKAVTDQAVQSNLDYLAESYPKAFQALQHVANGGNYEDLITPEGVDYTVIEFKEEDVVAQKAFMQQYYQDKGFSEAKALRNVEDDEDSEEGLYKSFQDALKERQESQTTKEKAVFKKQEEAKAAQDAQDKKFGETVSSVINAGQIGNFKIDKKDAENFYSHVLSHTERKGEGYALTIPLTNDNFQDQLQQLFFGFKKGDLSKFITSKSKSEGAKRLRRSLSKEKKAEEGASEGAQRKRGKELPTMGDFGE